jgi:hypothetical protein
MKKYVIIAGCSYAFREPENLLPVKFDRFGDKNEYDDIEFIYIGASSASNEFIVESITITIDSLFDIGILPQNIFVINNFTQIGRPFVKLPNEYHKMANDIISTYSNDNRYLTKQHTNPFYYSVQSLIKIKNQIYSFLISDKNLSGPIKDWYDHYNNVRFTLKTINEYFESYLNSIVILQSFLKKYDIKHISFLMNNTFDGWDNEFKHLYNNHTTFTLPSTKGTKHISNISDYTKVLWDCIDLNSFVFHQTKENKYGGIDEYMLDKYPNKKYLQNPEREELIFGNHPNAFIYKKFAEDYIVDNFINWYNETYN